MVSIIIFSVITCACMVLSSPEEDIKFEDIKKNNSK